MYNSAVINQILHTIYHLWYLHSCFFIQFSGIETEAKEEKKGNTTSYEYFELNNLAPHISLSVPQIISKWYFQSFRHLSFICHQSAFKHKET